MNKLQLIFLFIFTQIHLNFAQKIVVIDSNFVKSGLGNSWVFFEDKKGISSFDSIKKISDWKKIEKFPITFSTETNIIWLKTIIHNSSQNSISLHFITKGIDSLNCFWQTENQELKSFITGKNIPLSKRLVPSQYLAVPIELPANTINNIYIRIYNLSYQLALPYLLIAKPNVANQFIKTGEIGYNVYFGGLLLMILFSILLFCFFKERLYFMYLFCLIGSFIMAAIYNDYHFLVLEKVPEFIRNKNIFALITTILNILYLLFAEQYLKIDIRKNTWIIIFSRVVIFLLLFILIILLILGKELYHYRMYFYPLFALNVLVMNYYLIRSIQKRYSPSWYFLVATTPIALVSILEITSDFNGVPVQTMHDLYYTGTFIEMVFLTIGIVFRFRIERSNYNDLQTNFFATEINTQNRERDRIAKDLHTKIGSTLVGIQYRLSEFIDKNFAKKDVPNSLQKALDELQETKHNLREISHNLIPPVLSDFGLIAQIHEKYGDITKPEFKLNLPEEKLKLNSYIQKALYEIILEAVQNCLNHAKATEIGIELSQDDKTLRLRIEDNGVGFDKNNINLKGIGLDTIKFKAENQLKGNLTLESSPGNGTIILLKLVLKSIPKIN